MTETVAFDVRLVIQKPVWALTQTELKRYIEAAIANHPILARLSLSNLNVKAIVE